MSGLFFLVVSCVDMQEFTRDAPPQELKSGLQEFSKRMAEFTYDLNCLVSILIPFYFLLVVNGKQWSDLINQLKFRMTYDLTLPTINIDFYILLCIISCVNNEKCILSVITCFFGRI